MLSKEVVVAVVAGAILALGGAALKTWRDVDVLKEQSKNYALKTEIPDHSVFALKTDLPDLSVYALKSEIPELTNLANYALKSEIPPDRLKMAVVAFDLSECPDDWSEYEKAHGRFIRGIDRGQPKIDPDGERQPGGLQDDEFESHAHTRDIPEPYSGGRGNSLRTKYQTNKEVKSSPEGGLETRPKNVALLYCFRYR